MAADGRDRRFRVIYKLLRGHARHDAICRDHIENVQPLDGGRRQCRVASVFFIPASGYHRMRRCVRDRLVQPKILPARHFVAALCRQRSTRVHIQNMLEWPVNSPAETVTVRAVEINPLDGVGRHRNDPPASGMDYLLRDDECEWVASYFGCTARRDALRPKPARHNYVLPGSQARRWNKQLHGILSLFWGNVQGKLLIPSSSLGPGKHVV